MAAVHVLILMTLTLAIANARPVLAADAPSAREATSTTPTLATARSVASIPEEALRQHWHNWDVQSRLLRALQVMLSLMAIAFSVLVAANLGPQRLIRVFAVCSALATGLVSAFDPGGEANRMRNAWRVLSTALLRYETGQISIDKVVDAYERGESSIGDYTVSLNAPPSTDSKTREEDNPLLSNPPQGSGR